MKTYYTILNVLLMETIGFYDDELEAKNAMLNYVSSNFFEDLYDYDKSKEIMNNYGFYLLKMESNLDENYITSEI